MLTYPEVYRSVTVWMLLHSKICPNNDRTYLIVNKWSEASMTFKKPGHRRPKFYLQSSCLSGQGRWTRTVRDLTADPPPLPVDVVHLQLLCFLLFTTYYPLARLDGKVVLSCWEIATWYWNIQRARASMIKGIGGLRAGQRVIPQLSTNPIWSQTQGCISLSNTWR